MDDSDLSHFVHAVQESDAYKACQTPHQRMLHGAICAAHGQVMRYARDPVESLNAANNGGYSMSPYERMWLTMYDAQDQARQARDEDRGRLAGMSDAQARVGRDRSSSYTSRPGHGVDRYADSPARRRRRRKATARARYHRESGSPSPQLRRAQRLFSRLFSG
jgi:hypothetical protein